MKPKTGNRVSYSTKWPGKSPLDSQEAVRRTTRGAAAQAFLRPVAGVGEAESDLSIALDGKPIKTPSGRRADCRRVRSIADAIASEWNEQGETIDPLTMR